MSTGKTISVIVPALNEEDNITALFGRIDQSLRGVTYEVLLVDDHSTDSTVALANSLKSRYPIRILTKAGQPGKAQSLLEGFAAAQYDVLCMIDADLQYPPEAIGPMLELLHEKNADVIVTDRVENETSVIRKVTSKGFNFVFARLLFGISYDTQSGLKLFRKAVLNDFEMKPSPWSFDLEFLVRSLEHQRRILSYTIPFSDRTGGATKVKVLQVAYELAKASLLLRWRTSKSKVRAGHRRNSVFIRKAFPASLLLFVSLATWLYTPNASAAVQPLTGTSQPIVTSLVEPVSDVLTTLLGTGGTEEKPADSNEQTTDSKQVANPGVTTASSSTPNLTAVVLTQSTTSPTTTNFAVSNTVRPSSTTVADLTAATAPGSGAAYNDTAYAPSGATKRGISIAATAALTAGFVCLITAAGVATFSAIRRRDRHRVVA